MQKSSLYCPKRTPRAVQIEKLPSCTARIAHRRQYKLQNGPPVLPDSRPTGSTKCKTPLLYCPIHAPRAVQIAKPSFCTARISHREQCKMQNRLPVLLDSHTAGSVTDENTPRHCYFTATHQFSGSVETKTIPQHCPIFPTPQHKGSASAQ